MNAELTFLNALQALRTPALDGVMRFFTHLGDSGFVWLALTALLPVSYTHLTLPTKLPV